MELEDFRNQLESSRISQEIYPSKRIHSRICNFSCFVVFFTNDSKKLSFAFSGPCEEGVQILEVDETNNKFTVIQTRHIKVPINEEFDYYSMIFLSPNFLVLGSWEHIISLNLKDEKLHSSSKDFEDYAYELVALRDEEKKNSFASVGRGSIMIWNLKQDGRIEFVRDICGNIVDEKSYMLRCYQTMMEDERVVVFGEGMRMINWKTKELITELLNPSFNDSRPYDTIAITSFVREEKEYFVMCSEDEPKNNIQIVCFDPSKPRFEKDTIKKIVVGKLSFAPPYWIRDFLIIQNKFLIIPLEDTSINWKRKNNKKKEKGKTVFRLIDVDTIVRGTVDTDAAVTVNSSHETAFFKKISVSQGDNDLSKRVFMFSCYGDRELAMKDQDYYRGVSKGEPIFITKFEFLGTDPLEKRDLLERLMYLREICDDKDFSTLTDDVLLNLKIMSLFSLKIPKTLFY